MDENKQADIEAAPAAAPEAAPSQESPIEQELAKAKATEKSRLDKLKFTKERVEKQIAEEEAKMGIEPDDDDKLLTIKDLKEFRLQEAQETALTMVDTIDDAKERELTKYHLENTIKPSGDPHTDFINATLLVNAVKNGQKAAEMARIVPAKRAGSAQSAPPKQESQKPELSKEQQQFMRQTGLTEEEALAALK